MNPLMAAHDRRQRRHTWVIRATYIAAGAVCLWVLAIAVSL